MSDPQDKQYPVEPDNRIPVMQAEQPQTENVMLAGVSKMVVPTIMQCGQGGFLVTIPGVGLKAATTMEEVMAFIQESATRHFTTSQVQRFPKVVNNLKEAMTKAAEGLRKTEPSTLLVLGLAGLIGMMWLTTGDKDGRRENGQRALYSEARSGSPLRNDSGGSQITRTQGPEVLPEIHVLGVRTTPYYGRAERPVQDWKLR